MGSGVLRVLWPPDRIGNGHAWRLSGVFSPGAGFAWLTSVDCSKSVLLLTVLVWAGLKNPAVTGSNQACRAISTSQLKALLLLHLWPIDVVVFHGPQGRPCFEGGFPLRCLQRLSCPNIATQHCRWHDNWSTSGSFTPVLSY